jgi:hypothetical protein
MANKNKLIRIARDYHRHPKGSSDGKGGQFASGPRPMEIKTDKAYIILRERSFEYHARKDTNEPYWPTKIDSRTAKEMLKTIAEVGPGKKLAKYQDAVSVLVQTAFPEESKQDFLFVNKFIEAMMKKKAK